jgi:hypothetical protein
MPAEADAESEPTRPRPAARSNIIQDENPQLATSHHIVIKQPTAIILTTLHASPQYIHIITAIVVAPP